MKRIEVALMASVVQVIFCFRLDILKFLFVSLDSCYPLLYHTAHAPTLGFDGGGDLGFTFA